MIQSLSSRTQKLFHTAFAGAKLFFTCHVAGDFISRNPVVLVSDKIFQRKGFSTSASAWMEVSIYQHPPTHIELKQNMTDSRFYYELMFVTQKKSQGRLINICNMHSEIFLQ